MRLDLLLGLGILGLTACTGSDKETGETADTQDTDLDETDTQETAESGETDESDTETGEPPTDADGDGHYAEADGGDDCDDTDDEVYPGAPEVANDGVDQDCDGADLVEELPADDLLVGDVVITEVMQNPEAVGDSEGEWFEVWNATAADIDLEGLVVTDAGGASFTVEGPLPVPAQGYVVFGYSADTAANGGAPVSYVYVNFSLSNGDDEIILSNASGTLDQIAWDGGKAWPDPEGASMVLHPSYGSADENDSGDHWCVSTSPMTGGDLGTPGAANDACGLPVDADGDGVDATEDCDDGDASVYPGAADLEGDGIDQDCDGVDGTAVVISIELAGEGDLVVNEIMNDPTTSTEGDGEWFEVVNTSTATIDLDGAVFTDDGTNSFTVSGTLEVAPGGFLVFADNGDYASNGGVLVDYEYSGFALANTGDVIQLANSTTVLDRVAYDDGATWPDESGTSKTRDPGYLDVAYSSDASRWCLATSSYGTMLGTPGATNDSCGLVDEDGDGILVSEGDCDDADASVYPGATETPGDGIDQDCDGEDAAVPVDDDADGFTSDVDCNDADPTVYPGATETWDDGIDQDCDGADAVTARPGPDDLAYGDLVVSEVMPNPAAVGDSVGEWFEVYNASGGEVDLDGLVVSDSTGRTFTVTGSLVVAAGAYVVFGESADEAANGGLPVDYVYSSFPLSNGADDVWLANSSGYLDQMSWDTAAGWTVNEGYAMALDPAYLNADDNDDPAWWCDAASTYGDGDRGTPGAENDRCVSPPPDDDGDGYDATLDCNDADASIYPGATEVADDGIDQDCDGADLVSPAEDLDGDGYDATVDCDDADPAINPGAVDVVGDGIDQDCDGGDDALTVDELVAGDLVLTEIFTNVPGSSEAYGEWFEIHNASTYAVDLDGLALTDDATNAHTVAGTVRVEPGDYALFVASSDASRNGGLTPDYAYGTSGFALGNGVDAINASNAAGLLDRVVWDDGATFPDTEGYAMALDPSALDATSNDLGASWCDATSLYDAASGSYGTPGAMNDACAAPDADADGYDATTDCNDADASVYPGAAEVYEDGIDQDCDGVDAAYVDADGDGYDAMADCNDADASVYPGAAEVYEDGVDQDCDGVDATYGDADGDGYDVTSDCNDADASVYPGAAEVYEDGVDQDCDGVDATYVDADGDGYDVMADCDDADAAVNPGAVDVVGDDIDQDCDGEDAALTVDELVAGDLVLTEIFQNVPGSSEASGEWFEIYNASAWPVDLDGLAMTDDGSNTHTVSGTVRVEPGEYAVFISSGNTALNGGIVATYAYGTSGYSLGNSADAINLSNAAGLLDRVAWDNGATFPDTEGYAMTLDGDAMDATQNDVGSNWCNASSLYDAVSGSYGTPGAANDDCAEPPPDADADGVDATTDCNDADPTVYPGAPEIWNDGVDQDCDGEDVLDADADGWPSSTDCDDSRADVNPGATEVPEDGTDQDCDGYDATFADDDGDGYDVLDDCNDADASIYPGAPVVYGDGIDQDCDGSDETMGVDDLVPGDLVITEIFQNVPGSAETYGEWFELYNASGFAVDLDGLRMTDDGTNAHTVAGTVVVEPGAYAVFITSADTTRNGGVTATYAYGTSGFALGNGTDAINLSNSAGLLERVGWDDGATFPDVEGYAMVLDGDAMDSTSNDAGANWCQASSLYDATSGSYGTPGAANDDCAEPAPDADGDGVDATTDCNDADPTIYPGALETWNDGIDQDCDGVDVVDADVDGWASTEDCDDGDPTINPDAEDVPADGIDQDCSGSDAAADDVDGDGYDVTVDCNDADATVYPGATEVPDDGIDQDCDGVDAVSPTVLTVDELVVGDILITEIFQNVYGSSETYGEWFEVYNPTSYDIDLGGLRMTDSGTNSHTVSGSVVLEAGTYGVFMPSSDTSRNGGISDVLYVYGTSGYALGNSSDAIILSNTAGVLDRVDWDNGATFPDTEAYSMTLDPGAFDTTSNDVGANWCNASSAYEVTGTYSSYGTPGAANDECAP